MTSLSKSRAGGLFFKLALLSGAAVMASGCSYEFMGPDGSGVAALDQRAKANEQVVVDAYEDGKAYYKKGLYGLALKNFQAALSQKPKSIATLNAVAATYDKLGRFDLSRRYYARALALDPESPQTLNNIGYSFVMQRDFASARVYFERARKAGGSASMQSAVGTNLSALDSAEGRAPASALADASPAAPVNASGATPVMVRRNASVTATGEDVGALIPVVEPTRVAVATVPVGKVRNRRAVKKETVLAEAPPPNAAPVAAVEVEAVALVEPENDKPEPAAADRKPVALVVAAAKNRPEPAKPEPKLVAMTQPAESKAEPVELPRKAAMDPEPAKDPVVLAKIAEPHAVEVKHQVSAKMSAPVTALPVVAGNSEPTLEISNGAGRRYLAARTRDYLKTKGVEKARLTNADHFSYEKTTVFYRDGFREQAHQISHMFPMPVAMRQVEQQRSDIRVLLGADSLDFDSQMLAMRTAGS